MISKNGREESGGIKKKDWVDFKVIKEAVTMQMVLDHFKVSGLRQVGGDLRGPCPIHRGGTGSKHLSVNLSKNAFTCFSSACGARGNVLDFVAAMEHCPVRDAALKLQDWFEVGDSAEAAEEVESADSLTDNQLESLKQLSGELDTHASRIAYHSSQVQAKIVAVKDIIGSLKLKGD